MSNLKIFLSKEESFLGSALRIKEEAQLETEILYIEDFMNNERNVSINNKDIIYFLSNMKKVSDVINKISKLDCFIFNKEFLKSNYSKDEVQKILHKNGIKVPEIILFEEIEKDSFPLFCKQKKHTGITFQTYSKSTLISFFDKFDKKDFYLEEAITNEGMKSKEIKVYYVDGSAYFKDEKEMEVDEKLENIGKEIAKYLKNIDTFSVDFMKVSDEYYVIDINPASGFYLSTAARRAWFKKIREINETSILRV